MNSFPANIPDWLFEKFLEMGGILSFHDFMNITLNDSQNGYYGSGKAKIGIDGDFVTSPSLSNDFASLLGIQIEDWFIQFSKNSNYVEKFNILEFGSGNGCLMEGIINYFLINNPEIVKNISFKIIEVNLGMISKQKNRLKKFLDKEIDISWIDLDEVEERSINGLIIAHEVLDAFPVERIQYKDGNIYRQGVELDEKNKKLKFKNIVLTKDLRKKINEIQINLGVNIPPRNAPDEWTTELHVNNSLWLRDIYKIINNGILLIIDYAIDSKRYYSIQKNDGTILSYKNQKASNKILDNPGDCDLTCHICSDVLISQAESIGFESIGIVKQGEALLSLGLAQKLFEIQDDFKLNLSQALLKREALLRLVDPICLGDFKWFVFKKLSQEKFKINTRCLN
tara:strand:- start:1596 stop:2786 length:1191 start_codon:yes stop_codon:yes gene_type:complete